MRGLIRSRLVWVAIAIPTLVLFGACGYVFVEGWSFFDGLYMSAITIATIGYGETNPLSAAGRSFTIVLIAVCFVATTISSAILTSFILENDLSGEFVKRRVHRMISKLSGHTIVCGAGRLGQAVVDSLVSRKRPVVVVDTDKSALELVRRRWREALVIEGSATDEMCLAKANVLTADNVVVALASELDNLLVAITCKDLGRRIRVFARSDDPNIANRMRKAGVDEVLSPSHVLGACIATRIEEGAGSSDEASLMNSLFGSNDGGDDLPVAGLALASRGTGAFDSTSLD